MSKAAISVSNAVYVVECSQHNVVDENHSPQEAREVARTHAQEHKDNGDQARVFTGGSAWRDAQAWSR